MSAPDLSPVEAATVARFDAAPDAEESLRERVARALFDAENEDLEWDDYAIGVVHDSAQDDYRALADAAIALIRGDDA